ncbi:MAG: AMP-binding protein, partial [Actinobacteria bacterium]|nr:AMP-binding protein [Actinomycetota bacterium]
LVFFEGHWVGRDQLAAAAADLAEALRDAGVESGEVVASLVPTSPAAVAAMFGVWAAGAALLPLNVRLTPDERAKVMTEVRPAAVVELEDDRLSVVPVPDAQPVDREIALVLYTSGTTGQPKPVMLRHRSVLAGIDAVLDTIGLRAAAKKSSSPMPNLVPFSLNLWSGLYNVCFSLRVGAPIVLMRAFDPGEFASLVRRFGIKSSVLAPGMLAMLLDDPGVNDLAPLRFVRNATAPLSPERARAFRERFGVVVLNGYGQSELGGEVVGWNAADAREFADTKLGAVGRPHPGIEVSIRGEGDERLPAGEVGEVCVRSPYVMAGYLAREAESARFTDDGLLRTGDLGRFDHDGFLWLEGRRSELINRSGLKVFPGEVEEALRDHATVGDVAVAAMPDDRVGEVPWAFVVPRAGAALDDAELEAHARERLVPYKVPARFVAVDALPRNEVGKVVRRELQARFSA